MVRVMMYNRFDIMTFITFLDLNNYQFDLKWIDSLKAFECVMMPDITNVIFM